MILLISVLLRCFQHVFHNLKSDKLSKKHNNRCQKKDVSQLIMTHPTPVVVDLQMSCFGGIQIMPNDP